MISSKLKIQYSAIAKKLAPMRFVSRRQQPRAAETAQVALKALSAAALALPGVASQPAKADDNNQVSVQYGYYQEGERNLAGHSYNELKLNPIRADNQQLSAKTTFADRIKLALNFTQDTWSGATPITTAPEAAMTLLSSGASMAIQSGVLSNKQGTKFYSYDANGRLTEHSQAVHMMAMASPETRRQGDARIGYEWDHLMLDVGGGLSSEHDYDSSFVNSNGRYDFNNKLSTLSWGLSYTDSAIKSQKIPQYQGYIDYRTLFDNLPTNGLITGQREDWAAHLGFNQVLGKNTLLDSGINYTYSSGFLENPYKVAELIFIDPRQVGNANGLVLAQTQGVAERRPNFRNQLGFSTQLTQYVKPFDSAVHLGYHFFADDWGINAHTFEADWAQPISNGWTVTPRFRFYSQSAASFYSPYFVIPQAISYTKDFKKDYSKLPIANFSSDQRLSGYGALSAGVTISRQLAKGVNLDAGFEYYTHQGDLKLGGGGESSYADYSSYLANASIKVDLSALANKISGSGDHAKHKAHAHHHHSAPAGVMYDHMLTETDETMVGYRYMHGAQYGSNINGSTKVSDLNIVNSACAASRPCTETANRHAMQMHMVELMYAPSDWLTLMLMPQFMDMSMSFRGLEGAPVITDPQDGMHHHMTGSGDASHTTGGIGDTGFFGMFKLFEKNNHHVHLTLGLSAPTGDINQKMAGNYLHYGMQLGSGTWDFKPSITYTSSYDRWSWGGQVNGIQRLQDRNSSGYALGNVLQSTAWGSYDIFDWLSASVRGVHTMQQAVQGEFNGPHDNSSPMDYPANYGGSFWDMGFGLKTKVLEGQFQGNTLAVEWLQPIHDRYNGYQLERQGELNATWSIAF